MSATFSSAIVVVDLDLTLIYSRGSLARSGWGTPEPTGDWLLVEHHEESGSRSYVSPELRHHLDALRAIATVVPVTTRTRAQFERISPLGSARFDPSVCANGATMLVNGVPDDKWAWDVEQELTSTCSVEQIGQQLDALGLSQQGARSADNHFCYIVVDDIARTEARLPDLQSELALLGWVACLSGRKLYALPASLTKAAAVARLARRVDAEFVVAIGDSILDLPMLERADYSIAPAHADESVLEIVDHVTPSSGPAASIECLIAAMGWLGSHRVAG